MDKIIGFGEYVIHASCVAVTFYNLRIHLAGMIHGSLRVDLEVKLFGGAVSIRMD